MRDPLLVSPLIRHKDGGLKRGEGWSIIPYQRAIITERSLKTVWFLSKIDSHPAERLSKSDGSAIKLNQREGKRAVAPTVIF
jgi:hypothetical protein